jgi:hypothetical protein
MNALALTPQLLRTDTPEYFAAEDLIGTLAQQKKPFTLLSAIQGHGMSAIQQLRKPSEPSQATDAGGPFYEVLTAEELARRWKVPTSWVKRM